MALPTVGLYTLATSIYKHFGFVPPPTPDHTTPLTSFTDGLIPSVKAMKFIDKIITDGLTDGTRPSVYQSSVKPISVANSIVNKKTHRRNTDGLTDGYTSAKKKFPAGTLLTE
jgi:hypothetical protein